MFHEMLCHLAVTETDTNSCSEDLKGGKMDFLERKFSFSLLIAFIKQHKVCHYVSGYIFPSKYVYFCKNLSNVLPNGILRESRQRQFFPQY